MEDKPTITFSLVNDGVRMLVDDNGDFKLQKGKMIQVAKRKFRPWIIFRKLWEMMFVPSEDEFTVIKEKKLI